jgi:hypothetical protein
LADIPAPPRAALAERPLLLSYAPAEDAPPEDFIESEDFMESDDFMSEDFMLSEDFIVSDDFVSDDDFVASEDFASLGLAAGEVGLLVEPVADGDVSVFVSVPVVDGELPLLSGPVEPPVAAPDEPLGLPDPLGPCASAGAATNAKVTASANAPVNVFIALPPCCCGVRGFPRRP